MVFDPQPRGEPARPLGAAGGGDAPELRRLLGGDVALYSRPDPTGDGANEDRVLATQLDTDRVLLAVADGVGGHATGALAAELALGELTAAVCRFSASDDDLRAAVLDGFERANQRILELRTGAATTLAVALIHRETIRCFYAGDTQVVAVGQRGRLRLQTMPHSLTGHAVEAGVIGTDEALAHDARHVLANFVGTAEMRIEMTAPMRLHTFDTVVVGTDGLFDNLLVREIADAIRTGRLVDAAGRLAGRCAQRMLSPAGDDPSKPDDASFVLFRLPRRRSAGVC